MEVLREEEEAVSARARTRRIAVAALASLALGGAGGVARADDQSDAEDLFERGRKLMERPATLEEACRTLQASMKLMDRGDTLLNLAECHRRQGKSATAWAEFDKALSYGAQAGFPEAIRAATQFRGALAAWLSTLTVTVTPLTAALPGLTVEVAGNPWPRERWNTAFAIDPGPTPVRARATGYKPFDVQVALGADKDAKTVVVVLEVEPPPPPPPPPPRPPPPPGPVAAPRPVWPWIVGAAGVALVGGAVGAEVVSESAHHELDTKCGTGRACPHGFDYAPVRRREVDGFGLFVGLGTGGVLALAGAGLGLGLGARAKPSSTSFLISPSSFAVRSTF
jgi:hypothetical protein